MKNSFYLLVGWAVVACGQHANAGWYDDIGASVLTNQQANAVAVPTTDDGAIADQVLPDSGDVPPLPASQDQEQVVLGQPGIQESALDKSTVADSDPPTPPAPIPDDSVSDAPLIDSEAVSPAPSSAPPEPMPDESDSAAPVAITENADTNPVVQSAPHQNVRYVKKRKSTFEKLIDCKGKRAWLKKTMLRH